MIILFHRVKYHWICCSRVFIDNEKSAQWTFLVKSLKSCMLVLTIITWVLLTKEIQATNVWVVCVRARSYNGQRTCYSASNAQPPTISFDSSLGRSFTLQLHTRTRLHANPFPLQRHRRRAFLCSNSRRKRAGFPLSWRHTLTLTFLSVRCAPPLLRIYPYIALHRAARCPRSRLRGRNEFRSSHPFNCPRDWEGSISHLFLWLLSSVGSSTWDQYMSFSESKRLKLSPSNFCFWGLS